MGGWERGGGGGGCLRLGVSRSPGNLGIAGRRRKLSSCSCLSGEASGSPACTDTHIRGKGGIGPGTGRCCLGLTAPNPEVGAGAVSSGRMQGSCKMLWSRLKRSRDTLVSTANPSVPVLRKKNTHTHRNLIYDGKNL